MEEDLSSLVKESPHKAPDAYVRTNAIGWRAVGKPKDKSWRIVEGNVSWRALGGLEALNWVTLTGT